MPQEGQESVTLPAYIWEKAERYFKEREAKLRKKGIKSTTKLISVWFCPVLFLLTWQVLVPF